MKTKEIDARQIMDAALAMFAEKGMHGVTMRAIASRAGCGAAKIYRLFPGKDGLLHAIAADKLAEMTAGLQEHLQGIVGTSNKLRKCTWFILHFFESCPEFASLMFAAIPTGFWHGLPTRSAMQDQALVLAKIVEEGQRAGEVRRDVNMRVLRDLYFGGLQRLTYLWLTRGMRHGLTDATDEFAKLVFDSIRKQPEEHPPFKCPFIEELEALRAAQDQGQ